MAAGSIYHPACATTESCAEGLWVCSELWQAGQEPLPNKQGSRVWSFVGFRRPAAKATAEESTRQKARSSLIQAAKDGSLEKSLQDFKEKAAMPEAQSGQTSPEATIPTLFFAVLLYAFLRIRIYKCRPPSWSVIRSTGAELHV